VVDPVSKRMYTDGSGNALYRPRYNSIQMFSNYPNDLNTVGLPICFMANPVTRRVFYIDSVGSPRTSFLRALSMDKGNGLGDSQPITFTNNSRLLQSWAIDPITNYIFWCSQFQ
jgi:hypothetical protein